jgi:hypothetical protein
MADDKTPISDLELPPRLIRALRRLGVRTAGGARRLSDEALAQVPNIGQGAIADLRAQVGYAEKTHDQAAARRARRLTELLRLQRDLRARLTKIEQEICELRSPDDDRR